MPLNTLAQYFNAMNDAFINATNDGFGTEKEPIDTNLRHIELCLKEAKNSSNEFDKNVEEVSKRFRWEELPVNLKLLLFKWLK